jgi:hypothetical protein
MEHNYEERRLINEANIAAKKAKELTEKAEKLKADRLKQNSYAVQSKIRGTPEWNRETMLQQERQVQADRATEQMFKHGIDELIEHIRKNGSIYGLRMNDVQIVHHMGQRATLHIKVQSHK